VCDELPLLNEMPLRVSGAMKKFPYSWPDVAYIVLVMVLPLVVAVLWQSETIWGFFGKLVGGMIVGVGIWLGLGFIVIRKHERKEPGENTRA
jgi:hypothetical protein